VRIANSHYKLFIERVDIRQEPNGDYALIVEPVKGEQQIFTDAEKAHLALLEGAIKSFQANDRYFYAGGGRRYFR
jgi:hypothetical protein